MSLLLALAPAALACSFVGPDVLEPVADPADTTAPAPPEVGAVTVTRGVGPRGGSRTSCDDLGTIAIAVARPAGDPDGEDAVGYRIALVDGALPEEMGLPTDAWLGPELFFSWIDEATDDQEAFAFTVALTPVDAAGNEGAPVEVVVDDPGSSGRACDSAAGRPALALALAAALGAGRRRRR